MDILRFITAGSVDDGKSTLIGRLLYDSKSVLSDQLASIENASKLKNNGTIDLALLTDGLRSEREQGITIDVAYKYFATNKRKFIIADAPGHVQYTRNMITGASNASLIIILIDARKGIVEQTRRHSIIASLLHIPHVVVAINKMDLIEFDRDQYELIKTEYTSIAQQLGLNDITFIPISALLGDNIVEKSKNMDWYEGDTLLSHLESVSIKTYAQTQPARFPVQWVIRPNSDEYHDYRGYAGKIISGVFQQGDRVAVLPSGVQSTIKQIELDGKAIAHANAPQSIVMHLEDNIDISRGDLIVPVNQLPNLQSELEVLVCWMDSKELLPGNSYHVQSNSKLVRGRIKSIDYKLDVNTLKREPAAAADLNDVVKITLLTASPLGYDAYSEVPENGSLILVDETSNTTAGAGLIL